MPRPLKPTWRPSISGRRHPPHQPRVQAPSCRASHTAGSDRRVDHVGSMLPGEACGGRMHTRCSGSRTLLTAKGVDPNSGLMMVMVMVMMRTSMEETFEDVVRFHRTTRAETTRIFVCQKIKRADRRDYKSD